MFKPNPNYPPYDLSQNRLVLEDGTSLIATYPENLLPDVVVPSECGDCVVRTSDLYDLFNQQRIESLGVENIRDFLVRYTPHSSAVSDAINKLSDDELFDTIKSRHIQSYSELMSWSKYLMDTMEDKISALSQYLESDREVPGDQSLEDSAPESVLKS